MTFMETALQTYWSLSGGHYELLMQLSVSYAVNEDRGNRAERCTYLWWEFDITDEFGDYAFTMLYKVNPKIWCCQLVGRRSTNKSTLVNLYAQLSLHYNGPVQRPYYCNHSTNPPVNLPLTFPLTCEQDPCSCHCCTTRVPEHWGTQSSAFSKSTKHI